MAVLPLFLVCSLLLLIVPVAAQAKHHSNGATNSTSSVTCPDGSTVSSLDDCPLPNPPSPQQFTCNDGSIVTNPSDCPSSPPPSPSGSGSHSSSGHHTVSSGRESNITDNVISCFNNTLDSDSIASHTLSIITIKNILPQCFEDAKQGHTTTTNTINILR